MAELEEKDIQNAVTFHIGKDTLQETPVVTSTDLRCAWGPVDPEDLDALNIVGLDLRKTEKERSSKEKITFKKHQCQLGKDSKRASENQGHQYL